MIRRPRIRSAVLAVTCFIASACILGSRVVIRVPVRCVGIRLIMLVGARWADERTGSWRALNKVLWVVDGSELSWNWESQIAEVRCVVDVH